MSVEFKMQSPVILNTNFCFLLIILSRDSAILLIFSSKQLLVSLILLLFLYFPIHWFLLWYLLLPSCCFTVLPWFNLLFIFLFLKVEAEVIDLRTSNIGSYCYTFISKYCFNCISHILICFHLKIVSNLSLISFLSHVLFRSVLLILHIYIYIFIYLSLRSK